MENKLKYKKSYIFQFMVNDDENWPNYDDLNKLMELIIEYANLNGHKIFGGFRPFYRDIEKILTEEELNQFYNSLGEKKEEIKSLVDEIFRNLDNENLHIEYPFQFIFYSKKELSSYNLADKLMEKITKWVEDNGFVLCGGFSEIYIDVENL
jgi:hypothetical protein